MVEFKGKQLELFIIDALDVAIKDDLASMEHPIYSLSKNPTMKSQVYEYKDVVIEFNPSSKGFPTIYDKDLIIFAVSHLIASLKDDQEVIPNIVEFDPKEFFRFTKRKIGGNSYKILEDSLDRLKGSFFKTNAKINGIIQNTWRGIINSAEMHTNLHTKKPEWIRIELASTVIDTIKRREVLTLNRNYFELAKPIERRLYELARKHCGHQEKWAPYLKTLHIKSGSRATLKEFRRNVRSVVSDNNLPDYSIFLDEKNDQVYFYPRADFVKVYSENDTNNIFTLPTWIYEKVREYLPKNIDVYMVESDWIKYWEKNGKENLKNPAGAFINFCKKVGGYKDKSDKMKHIGEDIPLNTEDINMLSGEEIDNKINDTINISDADTDKPSFTANYFHDKNLTDELINNFGYSWDDQLGDFVPPKELPNLLKKCPRIEPPPKQKIFMDELVKQGYVWDGLIFGYRKEI